MIAESIAKACYGWYTHRLRDHLAGRALPAHVAIVMDGNRR